MTGASRGLGAAIARTLGSRGFLVAVNYWDDAAEADAVVGGTWMPEVGRRPSARTPPTRPRSAGSSRTSAETWVPSTCSSSTPPGRSPRSPSPICPGPTSQPSWTTSRGARFATQAVVPGMRERGWGRIVHIGSDAHRSGDPHPARLRHRQGGTARAGGGLRADPRSLGHHSQHSGAWLDTGGAARTDRPGGARRVRRPDTARPDGSTRPTSRRPSPSSPPTIPPSSRGNASWSTGATVTREPAHRGSGPTPGLRMPAGSRRFLRSRESSYATGCSWSRNTDLFSVPIPCSPVMVPPRSSAARMIASNAASARAVASRSLAS